MVVWVLTVARGEHDVPRPRNRHRLLFGALPIASTVHFRQVMLALDHRRALGWGWGEWSVVRLWGARSNTWPTGRGGHYKRVHLPALLLHVRGRVWHLLPRYGHAEGRVPPVSSA